MSAEMGVRVCYIIPSPSYVEVLSMSASSAFDLDLAAAYEQTVP